MLLVRYVVVRGRDGRRGILFQTVLDTRGTVVERAPRPVSVEDHFRGREHLRQLFDTLRGAIEAAVKEVDP
ncbi:MAG: hypothetical protein DRJ56_05935, partial [Thermoprotei archaeon]